MKVKMLNWWIIYYFCVFRLKSQCSYITKKQNCTSVLASWSSSSSILFLLLRLPSRPGLSVSRRRRSWSPIWGGAVAGEAAYHQFQQHHNQAAGDQDGEQEHDVWGGQVWNRPPVQQQQNEAHLTTVHEQTLLPKTLERVTDKNCKLLVNDVNFNKVVLDMEGLSTSRCTLMKGEPLQFWVNIRSSREVWSGACPSIWRLYPCLLLRILVRSRDVSSNLRSSINKMMPAQCSCSLGVSRCLIETSTSWKRVWSLYIVNSLNKDTIPILICQIPVFFTNQTWIIALKHFTWFQLGWN